MKNFRDFLKEEVLPTVQVSDGGLDIEKPVVRAAINAALAGVTSQPAVTPYVVFNRISKLLAQYHIVLPRKFLEGDKGVEVFEIRQFGHRMGMTDSGEFVNHVPSTHYLFLQYGILSPFGITYAKPLVGGMFKVTARLVDRAELDKLLDMAEVSLGLQEDAECRQNAAKAMAPKEPMHDITSDEKKKGNKAAVADSEKGLSETRMPASVIKHKQKIANMTPEEKAKKFAGKSEEQLKSMARRHGFGKDSNEYSKTVKEEEQIEEGQVTGPRSYKGSPDRKRKAVQMALGRKHKDHPDWNPRTNPQYSALKLGRKLQKQGVTEEKGDKLTPGFNRKDFNTVAKEIGTGQGGLTIVGKAPEGGESKQQTIYPMSPKSTNRVAPDDVAKKLDTSTPGNPQAERNRDLNEKAPPGAKYERMVKHIKKGYSKGGLTAKEKSIAYATAWKAKKQQDEATQFDPSTEVPKNT
jgi:hypothetical protein